MVKQKRHFLLMLLVGVGSLLTEAPLMAGGGWLPSLILRTDTCVRGAQSSVSQFLQRNVPSVHDSLHRYGKNHTFLQNPYLQLTLGGAAMVALGYGLYTMYPRCCLRSGACSSGNSAGSTNSQPLQQQQVNYASSSNQSSSSVLSSLPSTTSPSQSDSIPFPTGVPRIVSNSDVSSLSPKRTVPKPKYDTDLRKIAHNHKLFCKMDSRGKLIFIAHEHVNKMALNFPLRPDSGVRNVFVANKKLEGYEFRDEFNPDHDSQPIAILKKPLQWYAGCIVTANSGALGTIEGILTKHNHREYLVYFSEKNCFELIDQASTAIFKIYYDYSTMIEDILKQNDII
jgi:hypothetical protein